MSVFTTVVSSPLNHPSFTIARVAMNVSCFRCGILFFLLPGVRFPNLQSLGYQQVKLGRHVTADDGLGLASVPAVISQQAQALGSFGQNIHRASHVMGVQQPRPLSGIATAPTFNRVYSPNKIYRHSNNSGRLSPSYGTNGRTWVAVDKSKPRGRRNDSLCDCIGTIDVFSEQNRGPRTRFRNLPTSLGDPLQVEEQILISNGNNEAYNVTVDREQYNSPEFVTKYKDAKFFIIKSYSEDNIHKSIKYGVWASTPNGNKKLDAAYREAQEKPGLCPIFLFFSVNASGQFCGVAEMTDWVSLTPLPAPSTAGIKYIHVAICGVPVVCSAFRSARLYISSRNMNLQALQR